MSQFFPTYRSSRRNIKIELNLSSYATKTNFKNVTHVDVSSFAFKTNLASLKSKADLINADRSKPVPEDLAKLSKVVKNDVVKKTEYDKLVTKVDKIDTTGCVLKTTYDTDKSDLEKKISDTDKKIPDTSDLDKKTNLDNEITEGENKIPRITGLATNSPFAVVENKTMLYRLHRLQTIQTITQKLVKLKRKLLIMIMTNTLLQNSIL